MFEVPWNVPVPASVKAHAVAPWVALPDAAHGIVVGSVIVATTVPAISRCPQRTSREIARNLSAGLRRNLPLQRRTALRGRGATVGPVHVPRYDRTEVDDDESLAPVGSLLKRLSSPKQAVVARASDQQSGTDAEIFMICRIGRRPCGT